MTKGLIGGVLIACWLSTTAYGEVIDVNRLADAIYLAEGGRNTRFPFGVKSVACAGYEECRAVTVRSIRNNIKRWNKTGNAGDFIAFMGSRWCPVGAPDDNGTNKHWINNVTKLYRRAGHG